MLKKEVHLTPQRILELSSAEHIAPFFSELGYDTAAVRSEPDIDKALLQKLHPSLANKIASFKAIAQNSDETSTLYVYLYVLRSITDRARQDIVRDLERFYNGDYLFVLADETFNQLEFVYIDRIAVADQLVLFPLPGFGSSAPLLSQKAPLRRLQVDRRHPSYMALRTLRRLSYTHSGVTEQCKAISNAYRRAETEEEFFNNHALFSDYYLQKRLPAEVAEWQETSRPGPKNPKLDEIYNELHRLYSGAGREFTGQPMQEIRVRLFEPVLKALGFTWTRPAANGKGSNQEADYTFTIANEDETVSRVICQVYPWGRTLDDALDQAEEAERQVDDPPASENPAAAMVSLLQQMQAQWGILTNGKIWRLYSARARSRATNYYEVDVEEVFAIPRVETDRALQACRYFWLFFRAEAFLARPRKEHPEPPYICLLDFLMRESEQFARALGDSLKDRIFEKIFPHFAHGFVAYAQATGQLPADLRHLTEEERAATLKPFFDGTLTFLYRLLFLLYAESRALLPIHDERYQQRSLATIKEEIKQVAGDNREQAPHQIEMRYADDSEATDLYKRLEVLFTAIDRGSPELNVPIYNGGLFITEIAEATPRATWTQEERVAHFLLTHKIPDRYLALGLDLLARAEDPKKSKLAKHALDLVYVDYKSLGVRQLGSIYEGLLEFKLRIAVEDLVIVKGKVLPRGEAIRAGQCKPDRPADYHLNDVYIENDRHERKATGSYYTPDYIVQYIIEQTVAPVLQEKFAALLPRFWEFQQLVQNMEGNNKKRKFQGVTPQPIEKTYQAHQELTEAFFDLKVLDPAMGSGHFLVDAVDYITDKMIEELRAHDPNPIQEGLKQMKRAILQDVEQQGVTIDNSNLTEISLLKRQVLKRCIFGVDLNPMAVELARVSLWLDCFTQGAPLSFLDHHLRSGNSLLGVSLRLIEQHLAGFVHTYDLAGVLMGAQTFHQLSQISDATYRDVEQSRTFYADGRALLRPYQRLANLWLSAYYGNEGAQQAVEIYGREILRGEISEDQKILLKQSKKLNEGQDQSKHKSLKELVERAEQLASHDGEQGKAFFHWDLEFPEVFFDHTGLKHVDREGFDVIIGNPPYVRQEGLGDDKAAFKDLYKDVYNSIADLYTYFIELGHTRLKRGRRFGMITANKFMRANYGAALRSFLIEKVRLEKLIDFGDLPVFGDAVTYPIIIISTKTERDAAPIEYALIKSLNFEGLTTVVESTSSKMPESSFRGTNWSLAVAAKQGIIDKLKISSVPLGEYVGGKIQYGIKTGFNEAFIIDQITRDKLIAEDYKSAEIIKPLIRGEDVKRYDISFKDRYLIFTRYGISIGEYRSIERYLSQYRTQLEPRPLDWNETIRGEWPGRKPGSYKWYEIQDNVAYYADFEKPKIISYRSLKSGRNNEILLS
ncbi:MAG: Eco57I restriction-modification methylase domain-containing protein [Chloroflexota bacterium]|nr:Eco57I restriction-modification methylase domain-containing protein [Chloroflexota bacterium]